MTEWVTVDVRIEHKTQDAVLVSDGDDGAETWVPKSLIDNYDDDWGPGDVVQIELRGTVAEEKGLV